MRLKIKDIQGKYATGKYQLLDPDARASKAKPSNRERGYRALEAGEVIEVSDTEGEKHLKASKGILEMTMDPVTRPVFFGDAGLARVTSSNYNVDSPERQEAQDAAKERVEEMLSERTAE